MKSSRKKVVAAFLISLLILSPFFSTFAGKFQRKTVKEEPNTIEIRRKGKAYSVNKNTGNIKRVKRKVTGNREKEGGGSLAGGGKQLENYWLLPRKTGEIKTYLAIKASGVPYKELKKGEVQITTLENINPMNITEAHWIKKEEVKSQDFQPELDKYLPNAWEKYTIGKPFMQYKFTEGEIVPFYWIVSFFNKGEVAGLMGFNPETKDFAWSMDSSGRLLSDFKPEEEVLRKALIKKGKNPSLFDLRHPKQIYLPSSSSNDSEKCCIKVGGTSTSIGSQSSPISPIFNSSQNTASSSLQVANRMSRLIIVSGTKTIGPLIGRIHCLILLIDMGWWQGYLETMT